MNIIQGHKRFISWYQKRLGLSDYGLLWLVFFKGVFFALLIDKIFSFSEIVDDHRRIENRENIGKVIIDFNNL